MKTATYRFDEKEVLDKIFSYLVKTGLGNISIRKLCKDTGIAQGSLYYWFSDKTMVICEATEYGLKKVTDEIFGYVFENLNNLDSFFSECLEKIAKYRKELRFIYQMAASPIYGETIRKDGKYFKGMYDIYTERLASLLGCGTEELKPIIYLFTSVVCDYAIWEDESNVQTEIDFIHSLLPRIIGASFKPALVCNG